MKLYYQNEDVTLYHGDCRTVMAQLPAESVSCIVTSPPFWGLRSYECEPTIWGGDPDCSHSFESCGMEGETYHGRRRWQHKGVSREETPEEWSKIKPAPLSSEGEGESSAIEQSAKTGRVGNGEPNPPSSMTLGMAGSESTERQKQQKAIQESRASGRESDAASLVNPSIPVQESPQEIPDKGRRNARPTKGKALSGDKTEGHESLDSRLRPKVNLEDRQTPIPIVTAQVGTGAETSLNESGEIAIKGCEAQGTILADVSISAKKSEDVGAGSTPSVEQGDRRLCAKSGKTGRGTGRIRGSADLPSGTIKASATDDAGNIMSSSPVRSGQLSPIHDSMICQKCGAVKCQLGLEPTVQLYVEHTMEWLRACKRVLRKDGVLWLDIGDSRGGGSGHAGKSRLRGGQPHGDGRQLRASDIPTKSLCLIPDRIRLAALDDGWIVRSKIIIPSWMPESADDRPTDSYRELIMLTKTSRPTFWWNERTMRSQGRPGPGIKGEEGVDWEWIMKREAGQLWGSRKRSFWHGEDYWYDGQAVRVEGIWSEKTRTGQIAAEAWAEKVYGSADNQSGLVGDYTGDGLRNLGDIWDDIPPAAYPDKHFATFAVEEPERCIKASCPAEICVKCGKARVRVVGKSVRKAHPNRWVPEEIADNYEIGDGQYREGGRTLGALAEIPTLGWASCDCNAGFEPGIVLDPFVGTGTTCIAARKLGRRCIGIDASEEYLQQAVTRLTMGDAGVRRMVAARRAGAEQGLLW